jgi:hypothetical protein
MHGVSLPDPFALNDAAPQSASIYRATTGITPRQITIDPTKKTLVLMVAGQSNATNILPSLYTPTNGTVISHQNIYDGAFYPISGPMIGATYGLANGPGCVIPQIADKFITAGKFDAVLIADFAVGGTSISQWQSGGVFYERSLVAMRRLASQGIVPGMTGVTFAFLWMQGENEAAAGTSQGAYTAGLTSVSDALTAAGFSGRRFVTKQTKAGGVTYAPVQAAQVAFVDNVTWFSGGDMDAIGNRQGDGTHFDNTSGASAATAIYNAMAATGAPY